MNIDFSDEQKLLRDQAMRLLESEQSLKRARAVLESQGDYDAELWTTVCEMGWPGTSIPEAYGGLGFGFLELCVIAEALGRHLAPVPFSSSIYLAAGALLSMGSEMQKQQWLPGLASGEAIGTLALAERPGPVTPARISTSFSDGTLSGTKIAVADGSAATMAVVAASTGGEIGLYLVDLRGTGVQRASQNSVDPARPINRIEFGQGRCRAAGAQ